MTTSSTQTATRNLGRLRLRPATETTALVARHQTGTSPRPEEGPTEVDTEDRIEALAALMLLDQPAAGHDPVSSDLDACAASETTVVDSSVATRIASEAAIQQQRSAGKDDRSAGAKRAARFGDYRLLRHLGSGRTSHVYLARRDGPANFSRHVALRMLRTSHSRAPERAASFVELAQILSRLHHGSIARAFDVGVEGGTHYLAMEYLHGMSLRAVRERAVDGLAPDFAITAIASCAEALHHARERQTGHGHKWLGIAPSQVMACSDGTVRLTGLRQSRVPAPAQADLAYCSPEHARGESVDARSEVFALGVMLYELLTGAHPYLDPLSEPTYRCARDRLLYSEIEPPTNHRPDLDLDLSAVVMTALARDPDERFEDCYRFGQVLLETAHRAGLRVGPQAIGDLVGALLGGRRAEAPTPDLPLLVEERSLPSAPALAPSAPGLAPPAPALAPSAPALASPAPFIRHRRDTAHARPITDELSGEHPPSGWLHPSEARAAPAPAWPGSARPRGLSLLAQAPPLARGTEPLAALTGPPFMYRAERPAAPPASRSSTILCRPPRWRRPLHRTPAALALLLAMTLLVGVILASSSFAETATTVRPTPASAIHEARAGQ